jgi:hypothetical protein
MAEIKRLNYFNSQFLVDKDFNDEQAYHRTLRYLHNQMLYSSGIVSGLQVQQVGNTRQLSISHGVAIDKNGREIVLPENPPPANIDLTPAGAATNLTVAIAYQDFFDAADKRGDNFVRTTERPKILIYGSGENRTISERLEFTTNSAPTDDTVVILARVTLQGGNVSVDPSVRKFVSSVIAANAIDATKIANGAVTADKLAANAVTDAKIANGAVTADKLAANAVTDAKIANGAVTAAKLATAVQNQITTLTRGADVDASSLHFHATIPQQTGRYHIPMVPLRITPSTGTPQDFEANLTTITARTGVAAQGRIPLLLPNRAQISRLVIATTAPPTPPATATTFQLSAQIQVVPSDGTTRPAVTPQISITSAIVTERSINPPHTVDLSTGFYWLVLTMQSPPQGGILIITQLFIDYTLNRLF